MVIISMVITKLSEWRAGGGVWGAGAGLCAVTQPTAFAELKP